MLKSIEGNVLKIKNLPENTDLKLQNVIVYGYNPNHQKCHHDNCNKLIGVNNWFYQCPGCEGTYCIECSEKMPHAPITAEEKEILKKQSKLALIIGNEDYSNRKTLGDVETMKPNMDLI